MQLEPWKSMKSNALEWNEMESDEIGGKGGLPERRLAQHPPAVVPPSCAQSPRTGQLGPARHRKTR